MRYNSREVQDWAAERESIMQAQLQQAPQTINQYQTQTGTAGLNPARENNPKRPPELHLATATLNDRVNMLAKIFSDLEQHLEAVLRPESPSNAKTQPAPGYGANTQLGQAIAMANMGVYGVINRIRDLLDRLEI